MEQSGFEYMGVGEDKLLIQYPFRVIRCGPRIYLRHTQKNLIASLVLTCGFCLHKISTKMGGGGGESVVRKEGFTRTLKTTLLFKATHKKFYLDFKSINFDLKKHFLHILETTSISRKLELFTGE